MNLETERLALQSAPLATSGASQEVMSYQAPNPYSAASVLSSNSWVPPLSEWHHHLLAAQVRGLKIILDSSLCLYV